MEKPRTNRNFALLRGALSLQPEEVVECLRLAGVAIGADTPRRWSRGPDAGSRRFSLMTETEFDAFCDGLSKYLYQQRQETAGE